jgi:hypothetical protein
MTSERPPSKPEAAAERGPADARAEREAKLAQALRANLRRRKGQGKPGAGGGDGGDSA